MARTSLPPGFRFHPTDVELVMYYLKRKVMGKRLHVDAVAEVNIYKFSPWDLPDKSAIKSKDLEWFFFCPREKKYASGSRVKRATENGYWKTTGKDRPVSYNGRIVGTVKTLVFHLGHAPKGERTDWVIHEYRILDEKLAAAGVQDNYALCKVFQKSGLGPKNGAQYGAPFNEADWVDSDADDTLENSTSPKSHGPFTTVPLLAGNGSSIGTFSFHLGSTSKLPETEKGPSTSTDLSANPLPATEIDEEVEHLLSLFETENAFVSNENELNQDHLNGHAKNTEVNDIYNDLADLDGWDQMTGSTLESSGMPINDSSLLELYGVKENDYYMDNAVLPDNGSFIELDDLHAPMNDDDQVGLAETYHHTAGDIIESFDYLKAYDFFSGGSFARADHSSAATQLHVFSERSNQSDNFLDILAMMGDRCYQEPMDAHNLDSFERQPGNGVCFTQDTERGTVKNVVVSRFIPAAELIDAQMLLLLSHPFIGCSSIHIKAEVTHRDGECTKEALRVMMEGSCSFLHYLELLCVIFWRFCLSLYISLIILMHFRWSTPHTQTTHLKVLSQPRCVTTEYVPDSFKMPF